MERIQHGQNQDQVLSMVSIGRTGEKWLAIAGLLTGLGLVGCAEPRPIMSVPQPTPVEELTRQSKLSTTEALKITTSLLEGIVTSTSKPDDVTYDNLAKSITISRDAAFRDLTAELANHASGSKEKISALMNVIQELGTAEGIVTSRQLIGDAYVGSYYGVSNSNPALIVGAIRYFQAYSIAYPSE